MRTTCKACATPAIAARQPDQTVVGGRAGQISTMPALCTGRLAKHIHPRNQIRGVESANPTGVGTNRVIIDRGAIIRVIREECK